MKTFVRILSVIVMMFAFIACSEDLYDHTKDGKDGIDGKDGKNGYSLSTYFDDLTNVEISYWDVNNDGEFNSGDIIISEKPEEGIRLVQAGECVKIFETVGTVDVDSFQVCNGATGPQGDPGTPGQNGEPGNNGKTIFVYTPVTENCNTQSSSYYASLGWDVLGTPFSINHIGASNQNGTLVLHDYNAAPDTIWSPKFDEPTAVDYLSFDIGSKGTWKVELFLLHKDGKTTFAKSEKINPVNNFVWYDLNTYQQEFVYEVDINDIQYQDVVKFGLVVTKDGEFNIPQNDSKNWTFHADNIYVHRIKIVQ